MDATFKEDKVGIGPLVRDSKEESKAVTIDYFSKCLDAQHVETFGLMRAVQFANEFGITHFELEGDALGVIKQDQQLPGRSIYVWSLR